MRNISCYSIIFCCIVGVSKSFKFPAYLSIRSLSRSTPDARPSTALHVIQWPFFQQTEPKSTSIRNENGLDPNYPWRFEGRFIFRPALVRVPSNDDDLPPCSKLLSLFGYTLGGSVVLEYDVSPVGPYREYVNMGGVVALGQVNIAESVDDTNQMTYLGLGQWGTNLYVSTQEADDVCKEVWGVPSALADIEFDEDGKILCDGPDETSEKGTRKQFNLSGWDNTRILPKGTRIDSVKRFGNIPIFWTPTIKALWAPISFQFNGSTDNIKSDKRLPVHKLRLSASALRLKKCKRLQHQSSDEIPIGLVLVVDNVLIEIGRRVTSGSISIFD